MSSQESFVGAMSNIFWGVAASSNQLQPIRDIRTEGLGLSEGFDKVFIPFLNSYVQSGLDQVEANLVFYGTSNDVWRFARGMDPSDNVNAGPDCTIYSVLCIFPSKTISRCFYFPRVTTTSKLTTGTFKNKPTTVPVTLSFQEDDPDSSPLVYKGTIAEMATIVGSRFPGLMY